MPFFSRPHISDIEMVQLSGETINLSGQTNFAGVLKSKGVEIDATLTGATSAVTGSVLTYLAGKIRLAPSHGGGGSTSFDSHRTTTRSGIPAVNAGGSTVNQFLETYFFPSVPPAASINGGGTRQFGNNAGFTLNWTATRNTQPITSITVDGKSVAPGFFNALPVGGSVSSGTSATIAVANVNQTYNMTVTTASESTPASTSVVFSHKRYFYGDNQDLIPFSDAATTSNVNLHDPANAEFASSKAKGTFAITLSNQFFYYVYPTAFGAAAFTVNGLSNTDFSFKDFVFTNPFGYSTSFRLYRSNNILNGTFNIAVA
jgi:hypothetical protein